MTVQAFIHLILTLANSVDKTLVELTYTFLEFVASHAPFVLIISTAMAPSVQIELVYVTAL